MRVSDLQPANLATLLAKGDLTLSMPPFAVRIKSDIQSLGKDIAAMYGDFHLAETGDFADFHVEVMYERGIRRRIKPQARFFFDGRPSFVPLPAAQAFPMLEWGLNWCVAAHSHQYLIIHAAVIERNGFAALLPAPPGSGKSTLCAGLIQRGWRLLSDELALCDMQTGLIYGMARPISLKNRSIEVIHSFAPEAVMTAAVPDTSKGTIALLRPPADAVAKVSVPAQPRWIVLPCYQAKAAPKLEEHSRAKAFLLIAEQSFNYEIHGLNGFKTIGRLIDQCQCLQLTYSELNDAVNIFEQLATTPTT